MLGSSPPRDAIPGDHANNCEILGLFGVPGDETRYAAAAIWRRD
jgi:hypothetical protein